MHFIKCEDLPQNILEIPDSPKKGLYFLGNPWPEHHKKLVIVGSRKPTAYGEAVCEHLIAGLAGYPISIISGLAMGIDALVHRLAIEHKLHTTAFPGSGLDKSVIYPATNRRLATEILDVGGGLVSEYEPTQKSAQWTFPRRNRLMAGLGDAVLVIEANVNSGTLITARLALEYNREVMVVPGSIFSQNSIGPHHLLRDGAIPATSTEDILEVLKIKSGVTREIDISDLSDDEQLLYKFIRAEPRSKDELIKLSNLDTTRALSVLTMLELKSITTEKLGRIYLK